MKKKLWCGLGVAAVLLVCAAAYFRPLRFSGTITDESSRMDIVITEISIENGEPSINPDTYSDITQGQRAEVIALLNNCRYTRTPATPFSDGSINDLGGKMLTLYVYDDNSLTATVVVASSGKVVVGDKRYNMKNADGLIEQIAEIVEQID